MKRSEIIKRIERVIENGREVEDRSRCIALDILDTVEAAGMLPPWPPSKCQCTRLNDCPVCNPDYFTPEWENE